MRVSPGNGKTLAALSIAACCVLAFTGISAAKAPPKTKELVYGMNLYQGKGFSGTFAPRVESKVSIVANRGNVVSPKITLVYYWPITGEYMADWETMNKGVDGKLQILKDGKVIRTLGKVDTGFYYPNGPYDDVATLLTGAKARSEFKRYGKATDAYYAAQSKYYKDQQSYEETITAILDAQQQGKKINPKSIPKSPVEPKPATWYVSDPFSSFIVNLPAGSYQMRLVSAKGAVIKDSLKDVRVVTPRRHGVGYDVSPSKKYPESLRADQPANVIYCKGDKVLFVNPYKSEELTQYDYLKITKLHMPSSNNGATDAFSWVYGDPINDAKLQVVRGSKVVATAVNQPFYIEQSGTDTARRTIVVFKQKDYPGTQASFSAYRVAVKAADSQTLRMVDSKGHVLPGSGREIRALRGGNPTGLLWASFAPLVVGLGLMLYRRLATSAR